MVRRRNARGASALECAITLPVMFLVLFTLLDLGLAATRYNALAEGARRLARQAILHGSLSPTGSEVWGPAEYAGNADDGSTYMIALTGMLPTMSPELVSVHLAWPDMDNSPRDRVEVELSYEHQPLIPGFALWQPLNLRSRATMHIVN
jgi:hypothetical protein